MITTSQAVTKNSLGSVSEMLIANNGEEHQTSFIHCRFDGPKLKRLVLKFVFAEARSNNRTKISYD